jgi:hypothetical protein
MSDVESFFTSIEAIVFKCISKYEMSSVVNTIMRIAIIILVVSISVLVSKYFMAISTTTTKKNRIYII